MKKEPKKTTSPGIGRLRLLIGAILLCAIVFLGRLYDLQVVRAATLTAMANHQYLTPSSGVYDRGTIYFTGKDGTLYPEATLQSGFILAIDPQLVENAAAEYQALSQIIAIDQNTFLAKAAATSTQYAQIADKVSQSDGAAISALNLPGVSLYQEKWRVYPDGTLAPQVIGFLSYHGNDYDASYGLEKQYDSVLTRSDDAFSSNLFTDVFSSVNATFFKGAPTEGDVVSTIDPTVQRFVDNEVAATNAKWTSQGTGAIVIDPSTGAIYAMSSVPTFDDNNYATVTDPSVYVNPLTSDVFEMGSIVKALTVASALDVGVVTASTTYNDTGCRVIDGDKICNYDLKAYGTTPVQTVLNDSLNLGAIFVMEQMGEQQFADYFRAFGLGSSTGIDLPDEATGLINNLNSPREVEYATASFGQGIAITPVEMVRAASALANGGTLITPHVTASLQYTLGGSTIINPPPGPRVLKPTTSSEISTMLTTVVDTAASDGTYTEPDALKQYSIAAKTGTAQLVDTATGGYYNDKFLHTFVGYFPAQNPQFLIFLYTINPVGQEYASHTLASPFFDIASFLANYYEIPPDR